MTVGPGTRLGPYEIVAAIGSGGMGEVYRARDPRLGRDVAIKVLSALQAAREDIRQRFENEARTISSLQHPHICTVFDIGHQDGVDYLVMEHLEGDTLEKRLERGPLPMSQVITDAIQIADAIDKAHRHGVIHRDIKPGNIMLTKTGAKLLDFGLAKLRPESVPVSSRSILPTNAGLTMEGTILGTLQYMAPEQIEAQEPDARTDIFAFGAVLYEMITGKKAFQGKTQASLIAAIIDRQPPSISEVRQVPEPALDQLVQGCLAKDPDERWQSAYDILKQLRGMAGQPEAAAAKPITSWISARSIAIVAVVALAMISAAFFAGRKLSSSDARPLSLSIPPPFQKFGREPAPAISPDGRMICFVAPNESGQDMIWVRSLDSGSARPLPETIDGSDPFWSPDSRVVAFFSYPAGKLKKVDVDGGSPQDLADAPNGRGGTWGPDNVILFVPASGSGVHRVSAAGGPATPVTKLDPAHQEVRHGFPSFLPDGDHFLYWVRSLDDQYLGTYAGSLKTPEFKHKVGNLGWTFAQYRDGYLFFARNSNLFAQSFDLKSLDVSGEAQRIAENVGASGGFTLYSLSVSQNGVLTYPTGPLIEVSQFTWLDREGRTLGTVGPPALFDRMALAPDGKRISTERYEAKDNTLDLWLDEADGTLSRLTSALRAGSPLWSPSGEQILYSRFSDTFHIKSLRSSTTEDFPLILPNTAKWLMSWSTDGHILFQTNDPATGTDLWTLALSGDKTPALFANSKFNETQGQFSPDSHFVAYVSDESGRNEVYIDSFPKPGNRVRVSSNGGEFPKWRNDEKELFFVGEGKLTAAGITINNGAISVGDLHPLFSAPGNAGASSDRAYFGVADNGARFVFRVPVPGASPRGVNVILNWQSILKR